MKEGVEILIWDVRVEKIGSNELQWRLDDGYEPFQGQTVVRVKGCETWVNHFIYLRKYKAAQDEKREELK